MRRARTFLGALALAVALSALPAMAGDVADVAAMDTDAGDGAGDAAAATSAAPDATPAGAGTSDVDNGGDAPAPATAPSGPAADAPVAGAGRHLAPDLLEVHSGNGDGHPAARSQAIQAHLSALGERLAAGDAATASEHLEQLQQLLPRRSLTLLRSRAWHALVAGDDLQARRLYTELAQRLPGDREATINLAVVEARLGEHEAAMQRLQRLLAASGEGWQGDAQAAALLRSVHRLHESALHGRELQVEP